ncbi:catalase-related domain-containing protein, partial [Streptomyces lydicus]
VFNDEQRDRLVSNVVGHVLGGVQEPVLSRVFEYWTKVDPEIGKRIEEGVRAGLDGAPTPPPAQG